MRTAIGQRHGVDLSTVPVDRTPQGATEVRRLQALAYTSDRGIVIPSTVGSLDAGPGEALLAHELTHVAQRARFGPNLPGESTPAGRLLEAEAQSAEMTYRSGSPWRAAVPTESRTATADGRAAGATGGPTLPLAAPTSGTPDADSLAASILDKMSGLTTSASGAGAAPTVFTPSWPAGASAGAAAGGGIQRAVDAPAAPQAAPAPAPQAGPPAAGAAPQGQPGQFSSRPSDQDLSNLTQWLYPLISYRLKGELREGRERAGLATDNYRRW